MREVLLDNIYIIISIIITLLLIIIVIILDIIKAKKQSIKRQMDPKEKIGFNINPTELKMYSKVEDKSKSPDDLQKTNAYTLSQKNK